MRNFGLTIPFFFNFEMVLCGFLVVKLKKDMLRKILYSINKISSLVKVFRQDKDLKPISEVISTKRQLNLVDDKTVIGLH